MSRQPNDTIRLGIMAHAALLTTRPELGVQYCEVLESFGVESVWVLEHVAVAEEYEPAFPYGGQGRMSTSPDADRPDPLDLLAWLAPQSSTLRLGTAVLLSPLHSPVTMAKRAATVDALSSGRLVLGVGIGWQREEYEAIGVPFADRGNRLEENIAVMRELWSDGPSTYHGTYVNFDRIWSRPAPVRGSIPIVVGGNSKAAVERAGRVGDGWFPFAIDPPEIQALLTVLESTSGGRTIEITAWPGTSNPSRQLEIEYVQAFVDIGASRLLYQPALDPARPIDSLRERLGEYVESIHDRIRPVSANAT